MNRTFYSNGHENDAAVMATGQPPQQRLVTAPNTLSIVRLIGAPVLFILAIVGQTNAFLGLFGFLVFTDWLDGKLAILLKQRTVLGARLDSWADAAFYAALLLGGLWLRWEVLAHELMWIIPVLASYALTTGIGLWKYGRWPSYHTRAAKTSWLLVVMGAICLLADWSLWPFRIAMVGVTLTNLEAVLITFALPSWHANVPSLYHAAKMAGESPPADAVAGNTNRQSQEQAESI